MADSGSRLSELEQADAFVRRHIGPGDEDIATMLKVVGAASLDDLIDKTVPAGIRAKTPLDLPPSRTEHDVLAALAAFAEGNQVLTSFIGLGYAGTITPPVILRNVLEDPGWYTAYTPYQAEIAQGRMEALLNFQTMVADLTAMDVANASLLDEGTAAAEAMTMAYHREVGIDTRIVRIFNTYGPRMRKDDGRAIPNFISQALAGDPITIYGDGTQTRSICYVSDLVAGIYRLMGSDRIEPVNIGNPTEMTILDLAQRIVKIAGSKSEIVYQEEMLDDPKVRQPDITLARKLLDWEPKVKPEEGLRRTVEWFREN